MSSAKEKQGLWMGAVTIRYNPRKTQKNYAGICAKALIFLGICGILYKDYSICCSLRTPPLRTHFCLGGFPIHRNEPPSERNLKGGFFMKTNNKILAVVMALIMIIGLVPISAFAENDLPAKNTE